MEEACSRVLVSWAEEGAAAAGAAAGLDRASLLLRARFSLYSVETAAVVVARGMYRVALCVPRDGCALCIQNVAWWRRSR